MMRFPVNSVRIGLSSRQAASFVGRQSVRMASGTTSGAAKRATEQVKSDAPWAITSLLVFGGMFVYVTAPPSKGGAGALPHSHTEKSHSIPVDYESVSKVEDKPGEGAPAGSKKLAEKSLTAEEGATKQKPTKSSGDIRRHDDLTFQAGTAAAKEGHSDPSKIISDPKKVVADAHTARQDKQAKERGDQPAAADDGENDDDNGEEEEKEE